MITNEEIDLLRDNFLAWLESLSDEEFEELIKDDESKGEIDFWDVMFEALEETRDEEFEKFLEEIGVEGEEETDEVITNEKG